MLSEITYLSWLSGSFLLPSSFHMFLFLPDSRLLFTRDALEQHMAVNFFSPLLLTLLLLPALARARGARVVNVNSIVSTPPYCGFFLCTESISFLWIVALDWFSVSMWVQYHLHRVLLPLLKDDVPPPAYLCHWRLAQRSIFLHCSLWSQLLCLSRCTRGMAWMSTTSTSSDSQPGSPLRSAIAPASSRR